MTSCAAATYLCPRLFVYSPCMMAARLKMELTNQDSAGVKTSDVKCVHVNWGRASFLPTLNIYEKPIFFYSKSHIRL